MIRKLLIILITLVAYSQTNASQVINTYRAGFQDTTVMNRTLDILSKEKIWFRKEGANLFSFQKDDLQKILNITEDITNKIIPTKRSANYSKDFHNIFINKLKEANIPYNVVIYGDLMQSDIHIKQGITTQWVVWSEKYTEKVKEIQNSMDTDIINKLQSE